MSAAKIVGMIATGLVVACVAFIIVLLLIKIMWTWTVPDLFPGAVEQGLVAKSISWMAAAKLAIVIAILSGLIRGGAHADQPRR